MEGSIHDGNGFLGVLIRHIFRQDKSFALECVASRPSAQKYNLTLQVHNRLKILKLP